LHTLKKPLRQVKYMKEGNFAVLDLGTNTFNILIVNIEGNIKSILAHDRYAVKIGKGGIQDKLITEEASLRALDALIIFRKLIDKYEVKIDHVKATATSAFRNAKNGNELVARIKTETGITVDVIDGDKEAELIYFGVKAAMDIGDDTALIMDIGGGSVEFIICNEHHIFWKKSYEIGAQRLLDRFHTVDPIRPDDIEEMFSYLSETLVELQNQIAVFKPKTLIGSSGTFDTLCEIFIQEFNLDYKLETGTEFELPINYFGELFLKLVSKDLEKRKAIPGMSLMRVDMIVVSICLIDYVLENFYINKIRVSFYSLKEGMLYLMTSKGELVY
jgi:exopolyphosphatase/guanosine-5'-triphosphate,3'-diphosphate pyrophosphatase